MSPDAGLQADTAVKVHVGALEDVPSDRCVAIGEGRAILLRGPGGLRAFQNRCLHQESKLEGGRVANGKLTCPLHFWRYDAETGRHIGGRETLPTYPVEVVDGEVFVDLPEPEPKLSIREMMLKHAGEWSRE